MIENHVVKESVIMGLDRLSEAQDYEFVPDDAASGAGCLGCLILVLMPTVLIAIVGIIGLVQGWIR